MLRAYTPTSGQESFTRAAPQARNMEDLRRQIVDLVNNGEESVALTVYEMPRPNSNSVREDFLAKLDANTQQLRNLRSPRQRQKAVRLFPIPDSQNGWKPKLEVLGVGDSSRTESPPPRTPMTPRQKSLRQKTVRFSINDNPNIKMSRDTSSPLKGDDEKPIDKNYEIRGNAIGLKRGGLRSLMAYKHLIEETEKRKHSFHTTLNIFRRRIRLNQEKFIQPHESTNEDYIIHRNAAQNKEMNSSIGDENGRSVTPIGRPKSSRSNVLRLRSSLAAKRAGIKLLPSPEKETDEEQKENLKYSYRLPDDPNWKRDFSVQERKDEGIPRVKTYVLEEDVTRLTKGKGDACVALTIHNLDVHNSLNGTHEFKEKILDTEISCDIRLIDWLEESKHNCVTAGFCPAAESIDFHPPPSPVRSNN
ncbi:hypothetical protein CHS0354_015903 [Potamilus streckersoni]|uniref:Uncharacterized protein n=1 Tax=Potamilus streckersoni TaxID=2493646 RepID=A0AAE0SDV8_9BIVA|nr:hypothetical protein CHS0354_015903 [Potamilus streckersoni]